MNQIEVLGQKKYNVDADKLSNILDSALAHFDLNNALIELNFVSKSQIRKLNDKFRHIDKPTDVLSFPQIELPTSKIRLLGSIIISSEIVTEKGEGLDDVVKHGLLHLLGYDHESDDEKWQNAANRIDCKL